MNTTFRHAVNVCTSVCARVCASVCATTAASLCAGMAMAHAKSSVTLYGVADAGIEYLNNVPTASGGASQFRMTSGNMATSRWGIRGTEDLGNSLRAVFHLESGMLVDTGAQGNRTRLFDRSAYVGLASRYGSVTLGRQTTPMFDTARRFDPMGFSPRYGLVRNDVILAGRADNAVKYSGTLGSLTASAMYSLGRTGGGELPGNHKVDRNWGAALAYGAGALSAGAAYDEFQGASAASADRRDRRALIGASYAMGPTTIFAGYRWYGGNTGSLPTHRSNLYWAGVRYALKPALTLAGAAYYTDARDTDTRARNADAVMFVASADYAFSRRTDVYLNIGYALNRGASRLGMNGYGSVRGKSAHVVTGKGQSGVVMGVRHRF
ncbi:porin [Cupriavidus sp. OTU4054]|uniref:porin n=1 Tax=unclassified Cupriavidus TaxID=2640874 RepID=UPI00406D14DE